MAETSVPVIQIHIDGQDMGTMPIGTFEGAQAFMFDPDGVRDLMWKKTLNRAIAHERTLHIEEEIIACLTLGQQSGAFKAFGFLVRWEVISG